MCPTVYQEKRKCSQQSVSIFHENSERCIRFLNLKMICTPPLPHLVWDIKRVRHNDTVLRQNYQTETPSEKMKNLSLKMAAEERTENKSKLRIYSYIQYLYQIHNHTEKLTPSFDNDRLWTISGKTILQLLNCSNNRVQ